MRRKWSTVWRWRCSSSCSTRLGRTGRQDSGVNGRGLALARPHPRVTASPLSLEERPLGRVSKDGLRVSWFETPRKRAAPHHEETLLRRPRIDRRRAAHTQYILQHSGAGEKL